MKIMSLSLMALFFSGSAMAQKQAPLPKDLPPYGPETPLSAPSVKTSTLTNGLSVWLVSEPGFPMIAVSIAVRGGYAADPADRAGISDLLAKTIDQGTKTRTAKQIAQQLQGAGGDLTISPGKDSLTLSSSFLSSKTDAAIEVLADVAQNGSFPDAEVTLAKRNAAEDLKQNESEPSFLAARAMAKALFGDHPYSVTAPTQESITASTAGDLRTIYATRFRPDQAVLVAVGDFENETMLRAITDRFGAWKAPGTAPAPPAAPTSAVPQHAVFFVPRPDSVQTTIQLGGFGPLRTDPDYEAALVANAIYGGTFGSRLVSNIREDKGYTYSPFAVLRNYRAASTLNTMADVRNEVTAPTFNEIMYELNRLATTSPTADELTQAKRFLVGIEAIQFQSRSSVADELARLWVNGLPSDEIGAYGRKVAATTMTVVAVGEEKVIREAFSPFALPIQVLK
jgi:zinc protease